MATGLDHFRNDGFGWTCRHCPRSAGEDSSETRLFREGESESGQFELSTRNLAVWDDREKTVLRCPGCGRTESTENVDKKLPQ